MPHNLIVTGRHYPISIMLYFKKALQKLGHNVWSVGTYSDTIPWAAHKDYSHMLDIPDLIVGGDQTFTCPIETVLEECPFTPDAILSFDSFFHCTDVKKSGYRNAYVMVDPHAAESFYLKGAEHYDIHFCMQDFYKGRYTVDADGTNRPVWHLPFAADQERHFWTGGDFSRRPYDVCILSGLIYPNRGLALDAMRYEGLNVYHDSAVFFDEASRVYGDAVIAFNWSSAEDLCARFWEGLSMRNLVLTNRVDDLKCFPDLQEDVHYVAYSSLEECVDKAMYYSSRREEAWQIASAGYSAFWAGNHSYLRRAETILDVLGLK